MSDAVGRSEIDAIIARIDRLEEECARLHGLEGDVRVGEAEHKALKARVDDHATRLNAHSSRFDGVRRAIGAVEASCKQYADAIRKDVMDQRKDDRNRSIAVISLIVTVGTTLGVLLAQALMSIRGSAAGQ